MLINVKMPTIADILTIYKHDKYNWEFESKKCIYFSAF